MAPSSSLQDIRAAEQTGRTTGSGPGEQQVSAARSSLIWRVLLGISTLAFLGVIVFSLRDTTPKEGGPAPAFSVVTDGGKRVTLDSFGGKVLVLNFWATWCAPCIEEIPSLNAMQKNFAKSGVVVLAVSVDKNQQKYRAFLDRIHLAFETARDPSSDISARYGTFQYPETYIIKDGQIMRKYARAEDWLSDDMTQTMRSLLQNVKTMPAPARLVEQRTASSAVMPFFPKPSDRSCTSTMAGLIKPSRTWLSFRGRRKMWLHRQTGA